MTKKKQPRRETSSGSKEVDNLITQHNQQIKTGRVAVECSITYNAPLVLPSLEEQFKGVPLGTKFHRKGTDPNKIYILRKSPQGYLYMYCKSDCEFVREVTVSFEFTPIG